MVLLSCVITQPKTRGIYCSGRGDGSCSGLAYRDQSKVHMVMHDGCQIVMIWSQHRGSAPKDGVFIMYHHTA